MRVVVTGARGLLGRALVDEAKRRGHSVVGLAKGREVLANGAVVEAVDLLDPGATGRFLAAHPADLIVHAAALTDVDACEERPEEARRLHADATGMLASAAAAAKAAFVYVSTDSVFGGRSESYSEAAAPEPLNLYARTKLEGERRAAGACPAALIVRTNFFGSREDGSGRSLAEWALRELAAERPIQGFTDVRFNPLWTGHLAALLFDLVDARATGVVHLASSEASSKYDFLRRLAETFEFDPVAVRPAAHASRGWRAERPLCTVLDVSRAQSVLRRPLPDLSAGLAAFRSWATGHGIPPRASGGTDGHR